MTRSQQNFQTSGCSIQHGGIRLHLPGVVDPLDVVDFPLDSRDLAGLADRSHLLYGFGKHDPRLAAEAGLVPCPRRARPAIGQGP
jgi:hypothetical protein